MGKSYLLFIALIALVLTNNTQLYQASTIFNSTIIDQQSLLSFKNSTMDPHSILAKNWSTTTSICDWIGVTCGIKHPRVTALNFSGFELAGTVAPHLGNLTFLRYLDISFNNFTGSLPSELSRLYRLKVIDLGYNSFTGEISSWFGNLPQLEQLHLNNNTFSGVIPPLLFSNSSKLQTLRLTNNFLVGSVPEEIGNCSFLETVSLRNNQLTGSIPYGIFNVSSMRLINVRDNKLSGWLPAINLPSIKYLNLESNQLQGEIPPSLCKCRDLERLSVSYNSFSGNIPSEIGTLSMLRELYLGFNHYKGGIPTEIGNLSQLEILQISMASLTGNIPSSIFNMSSLKILDLSENSLSGTIPTEDNLQSLSKLEELYLYTNFLSGQIVNSTILELKGLGVLSISDNRFTGELPKELGDLHKLEFLSASNNFLSGSIPSSIFNISTLKNIALSSNQFSDSLPSDMGKLSNFNLEGLYLTNNRLSGEFPSSISNASKLTFLEMANNSFSGSLPNLGNLRHLKDLRFRGNNLTGDLGFVSSLTNCQYLRTLDVSLNSISGTLPASIGNLSTSLENFRAFGCEIQGFIPSEIGNMSSVLSILLYGNQLTGFIPPTIGKLKRLQRLNLASNRLEGYIPHNICQIRNLGDLFLYENLLTGPIPECLGELRNLRTINLTSNKLNSTIPSNFWNLRDLVVLDLSSNYFSGQLSPQIGSLKVIHQIHLSSNQFSGDIPSSIDGCQSLEILSLSNNKFGGSIPESFGNIRGLTTLDLSINYLSGLIPKSLEGLNFLQAFNVSNNILEGEIPSGGPFGNFTAQSFFQNFALCGESRFQVPPCTRRKTPKNVVRLIKFVVPPIVSAIILVLAIQILVKSQKQKKIIQSPADISPGHRGCRRVSYTELMRGTCCFSETNLLGKGSFGSVFKGTLSDGSDIAVKVFNLQLEGANKSFDIETEILSTVRHRNLVGVIGCCSNTEFKALIFAFMSNGSLDKWLYSDNYYLNILQRIQIAIDVALALEYLHHGHTFPVIHCDIKPSNVLLDEDMTAHLGDFGIAKLFDKGEAVILTKTIATIGYAAPEYGSEGKVSTNGDVYSYGILLLEMFTSKKPTDDMFSEEMSLKEWVSGAIHRKTASEVASPALLSREDPHFYTMDECVTFIFDLAMKCLAFSPDERINMTQTVSALQKIKSRVVADTTNPQQHAISIYSH